MLEVIGGHLAKFRPSHVDYPQLDHLTDMDLRAFTAQRRVRLRERMPRKRVTNVLIFGDFALQSIDASFLQALGKGVYNTILKDVYSYSLKYRNRFFLLISIRFLLHVNDHLLYVLFCNNFAHIHKIIIKTATVKLSS